MNNHEESVLVTARPSFESFKKLNAHGVEYWSARDLQPLLGYTKWQRFENAIEKAIESCKTSGNNPEHYFTRAGKQIEFGKGATQMVDDFHLSRFAAISSLRMAIPENQKSPKRRNTSPCRHDVRKSLIKWQLI